MTENQQVSAESFKIPTRTEHRATIRRIWYSCILISLSIFVTFGGITAMILLKDVEAVKAVAYTTIVFQVVIAMFATGFTTPYFLETRYNLNVGMDMNRRALELGTQTANNLEKLEQRIEPLVGRIEGLLGKGERLLESAEHDGPSKLDRLLSALERIAARTSQSADDQLEGLLQEAWDEKPEPPPVDSNGQPS